MAEEQNGHPTVKGRTLLLFDVDGTLTHPRQKITPEMRAFMKEVRKTCPIAVVGGSDMEKIVEQLGDSLEDVLSQYDYVFSENGLVGYQGANKYPVMNLGTYFGEEKLQEVINFCLSYLSNIKLPVKCGNFIERRNGMLNVSPIGRSCTQQQRLDFNAYDNEHNIRKTMVAALEKHFATYNLRFVIGGQISFDVFPVGWDKTFCLKYVHDETGEQGFADVRFFGDKTFEGGNDYDIYQDKRVKGYTVDGPDTTKQLLESLVAEKHVIQNGL